MTKAKPVLLAIVLVLAACICSGTYAQTRLSPNALVADLYKAHQQKRSPFFQTRSRALLYKYFEKNLADMIWKDAVKSKGEVGAIDGIRFTTPRIWRSRSLRSPRPVMRMAKPGSTSRLRTSTSQRFLSLLWLTEEMVGGSVTLNTARADRCADT